MNVRRGLSVPGLETATGSNQDKTTTVDHRHGKVVDIRPLTLLQ